MAKTTERAHQVLDVAIKFNELMATAGINNITLEQGKLTSMFLKPEFFKMAFPSVEPIVNPEYSTSLSTFNEYAINYNGVKYYAYEVTYDWGKKNDTGKADNYTE